jgi:hypothetical protein
MIKQVSILAECLFLALFWSVYSFSYQLELKLGLGGTSYPDFIRTMHLPMQLRYVAPTWSLISTAWFRNPDCWVWLLLFFLISFLFFYWLWSFKKYVETQSFKVSFTCQFHCSQVDPIVASFSGGAVGVISALMVVEINNVKQQEHKRCKYCLGTGMFLASSRSLPVWVSCLLWPLIAWISLHNDLENSWASTSLVYHYTPWIAQRSDKNNLILPPQKGIFPFSSMLANYFSKYPSPYISRLVNFLPQDVKLNTICAIWLINDDDNSYFWSFNPG